MENKVFISFLYITSFYCNTGVGIHHKKLSDNKLQLHQNFIITPIDNFIV